MSGEVRDESRAGAARAGAQDNAAHDGGTQYITRSGDVKSVNVFLNRPSPTGETDTRWDDGGKVSTKMRAALVGSGFGIVTLAAALTVYAINSPRTAETANTGSTRPSATASAPPRPSASLTPSPSPSPTPTAAPPAAAPARTSEPAVPGTSAPPSKSGPATTHSDPYPSNDVYCGSWQATDSVDVEVRACTQAVDRIGRALFGAEIRNRGEESTKVSVLVAYVSSEKPFDCPKSDPWTGTVINPGDSWRSALSECLVDGLKGHAVQAYAWAVTGGEDPRDVKHAPSPTVHIRPDGTVVPPST